MIFDAGKWIYRNIFLSACNAARRFVPRPSSNGARLIGWRPLILRWRKRANDRAIRVVDHVAGPTTNLSFPRFHFYFSSVNHARRASEDSHEFPSVTPVRERTAIQNYFSSNANVARPRVGDAGDGRRLPQGHEFPSATTVFRQTAFQHYVSSRPKVADAEREKVYERGLLQTRNPNRGFPTTHFIRAGKASFPRTNENTHFGDSKYLFGPSPVRADRRGARRTAPLYEVFGARSARGATRPQSTPHGEGSKFAFPALLRPRPKRSNFEVPQIRTPSLITHLSPNELAAPRRSGVGLELLPPLPPKWRNDHSTHRTNRDQPLDRRFRDTDELIWRRTAQTITDVVERVRQLESLYAEQGSPAEIAAVRQHHSQVSVTAAPAVKSITKLDPSLVDRLTDDVIRKVDQRMRIERERRGL